MANDLDPCPFCACSMIALRIHASAAGEWWAIRPDYAIGSHMADCPLSEMSAPQFTTVDQCIASWNNRRALSLPSEVSSDLSVTVETLCMARDGSAEHMRGAIKAAIKTLCAVQAVEVPSPA